MANGFMVDMMMEKNILPGVIGSHPDPNGGVHLTVPNWLERRSENNKYGY